MCHLILLMPILGLPLFWLLPFSYALPSYLVIVLLSAFLYWLITRAMREPVQDGFQSLISTTAEVVSKLAPPNSARYLVRSHGELWSADAADILQPGEKVKTIGVKEIGLVVEGSCQSPGGKEMNDV